MVSILIADDHPVVLLGVKTLLEHMKYDISAVCANGIEAYNHIITHQPTLALLDLNMPGMTGIEITERLKSQRSRTKIILLTSHNELSIFNYAKELGVKGFMLKEFAMDEIEKCLQEVKKGETYFSPHLTSNLVSDDKGESNSELDKLTFAEKKILELVAKQKSSKEIAELLFISEKTVETHRSNIIRKLEIPPGKNALLLWAIRNIKR